MRAATTPSGDPGGVVVSWRGGLASRTATDWRSLSSSADAMSRLFGAGRAPDAQCPSSGDHSPPLPTQCRDFPGKGRAVRRTVSVCWRSLSSSVDAVSRLSREGSRSRRTASALWQSLWFSASAVSRFSGEGRALTTHAAFANHSFDSVAHAASYWLPRNETLRDVLAERSVYDKFS